MERFQKASLRVKTLRKLVSYVATTADNKLQIKVIIGN